MESDPIGLYSGSFSAYAYVDGNPISSIDPFGLAAHLVLLNDATPLEQALYNWAESYQPAQYNTVVVHGADNGQFAEDWPVSYSVVPPANIANLLKKSPGYDPTLPTQLVACSAGATKAGAQALANDLGATVLASQQELTPGPTPGSPPQAYDPETFWQWLMDQMFGTPPPPPPPINWIQFQPSK